MSPTSYQTAPPRDKFFFSNSVIIYWRSLCFLSRTFPILFLKLVKTSRPKTIFHSCRTPPEPCKHTSFPHCIFMKTLRRSFPQKCTKTGFSISNVRARNLSKKVEAKDLDIRKFYNTQKGNFTFLLCRCPNSIKSGNNIPAIGA